MGFAECKMTRNGPTGFAVCPPVLPVRKTREKKKEKKNQWLMSHSRVTTSGLGSCCLVFWVFLFFLKCCIKRVASNDEKCR